MKVKLNKDLCYARNGYEVITVLSGKIVTGRAAQLAIELGCGTPVREKKIVKPEEKKVVKPKEKK